MYVVLQLVYVHVHTLYMISYSGKLLLVKLLHKFECLFSTKIQNCNI